MPHLQKNAMQNTQPCNDVVERIEAMLEQARLGKVPNFAACLYFEDGSSVKFMAGQSAEEKGRALALLQAKIAAGY
jgi:hypothetical protein